MSDDFTSAAAVAACHFTSVASQVKYLLVSQAQYLLVYQAQYKLVTQAQYC